MSSTHLPPFWKERLIAVIGGKTAWTHGERHRFLDAWQQAEGGTAQWNPLNTTLRLNGSTNYNDVGVQNYRRATEGVCATALTLVNGFYGPIVGQLQSTTRTAEEIVEFCRSQLKTWGTNPDTILAVLRRV